MEVLSLTLCTDLKCQIFSSAEILLFVYACLFINVSKVPVKCLTNLAEIELLVCASEKGLEVQRVNTPKDILQSKCKNLLDP